MHLCADSKSTGSSTWKKWWNCQRNKQPVYWPAPQLIKRLGSQALLPALLHVIRVKLRKINPSCLLHYPAHPDFKARLPERYTERFWCDWSPSWTVMAHIKQNPASLHSQVLRSGLRLQLYCPVISLLWFQMLLAAWLLDAIQRTNISDFPYDAQYRHSRHLKQQLYWAALQLLLKKFPAFSPSKISDCSTSLACRCYVFLHVISKIMSSDMKIQNFQLQRRKRPQSAKSL